MQNECVLLHGWGMNQGVWQLIKPELEFLYSGKVKTAPHFEHFLRWVPAEVKPCNFDGGMGVIKK